MTITIDDTSGPVFIASTMPGASDSIGWGEVVAEQAAYGTVWGYTTVAVHHDGGQTSLLPGDVLTATIDGASWRVVPHAAQRFLRHDPDAEEVAACGRPPDLLSFEMFRVEAPPALEPVVRPADLAAIAAGCR
jgi:hypothetical protein